jgi:hypothetical protein
MSENDRELYELEKKVLAGQELSEDELGELLWELEVEDEVVDPEHGRWHEYVTTIFAVDGRLFALQWARGLTESQEDEFMGQPHEVVRKVKMVEQVEYVPIDKEAEKE